MMLSNFFTAVCFYISLLCECVRQYVAVCVNRLCICLLEWKSHSHVWSRSASFGEEFFNETSQECHSLWDVTQYQSSLPSVQCCGYVTLARALKCWNIRWVSQLRCLAFPRSVPLEECERAAKRRRVRVFPWELQASCPLSLHPQKPLCEGIMWMLLIRGRFTALGLKESWRDF